MNYYSDLDLLTVTTVDCMMTNNHSDGSPSELLHGATFAKPSIQPPGHFNASAACWK